MDFDPAVEFESWHERLKNNADADPRRYILTNPGDTIVAEQLLCYPKAERKFPSWHKSGFAYTKLALEQSSGEIAASYKASLTSGETLIDLTGGLGMDSLAFSNHVAKVHYVDAAPQPYLLAKHNHSLAGALNITHHHDSAASAIKILPDCDWIYIDPSRRNQSGRKFLLSDCEPDILQLWPELLAKSKHVMVKLSPMYDITALERELHSIHQILVVSVDGEVKEILAIAAAGTPATTPEIKAVCLPEIFEVPQSQNYVETADADKLTDGKTALIVTDPAITKARVVNTFATHHGLHKVNAQTDLLTGPIQAVPAASVYPIKEVHPYKPKALRKHFSGMRVHIHQRGFPLSTDELYKKLGLAMGEDAHLFFTSMQIGGKNELIVLTTSAALRTVV